MSRKVTVSPAEFANIPLDFVIAEPLLTAIEAHRMASQNIVDFVKQFSNKKEIFELDMSRVKPNGETEIYTQKITVPLLAIVKTPSLNFDSISVSFNYSIKQVYTETEHRTTEISGEAGTSGLVSKFVTAKLSGSFEKSSSSELTSNRSGELEVKIHASEAPLPAGLEKILDAMVKSIDAQLESSS